MQPHLHRRERLLSRWRLPARARGARPGRRRRTFDHLRQDEKGDGLVIKYPLVIHQIRSPANEFASRKKSPSAG